VGLVGSLAGVGPKSFSAEVMDREGRIGDPAAMLEKKACHAFQME